MGDMRRAYDEGGREGGRLAMWTIRAAEFARATRGWRCEVAFRVSTHRQCTMEDHAVYDGAEGHGPASILLAYVRGIRAMRREVRRLQALPGPWMLDGRPRPSPGAADGRKP